MIAAWLVILCTATPVLGETKPGRWDKEIEAFLEADRAKAPKKNRTLFIGSSSIKRWETLEQDFRSSVGTVIRRGFGGAGIQDATGFADRIILPYKPRQIVLYAGGNEIRSGASPVGIATLFDAFVKRVRAELPGTRIAFVSIKPSTKQWANAPKIKQANQLVREYCSDDMRLDFIDVWTPMLGADGKPKPELYVADQLHLSAAGYAVWTAAIKPVLAENSRAYYNSPERWESTIAAFEEADKKQSPAPGGIVFIGSSSIRGWKTLKQDFPGHLVINRGFGGSEIIDSIHFADRIVVPYKPSHVVLYAGDNDMSRGKTPEIILAHFKQFVETVSDKLPEARISFITIKPSLSRWKLAGKMSEANGMVREFCKTNDRLEVIDIWEPMLGEDGKPRRELFVGDGLHLNAKGYALWTKVVAPHLARR